MRSLLLCIAILFAPASNASPLVQVQVNGMYLYFAERQESLAARLAGELPDMVGYLSDRGLPISPPMHIVLDDEWDAPEVKVNIIPHKEIRIPLRAPGVLEDGYMETDPWGYFLFKGLCLQGIFEIHSGIPGMLHKGFGEIVSPNAILPPWVEDGICALQYSLYRKKNTQGPFETAIFRTAPIPDVDLVSNRPQIWPGDYAYRIFGRPFVRWLYEKYGWEKILEFLTLHGRGVVPFEIDLKATEAFGKTGAALWKEFQESQERESAGAPGLLVTGYWSDPFVYWNNAGVFPGKLQIRARARYGYVEPDGTAWISEVAGSYRIREYAPNGVATSDLDSVWDPGPGRVAVTRDERGTWIVIFPDDGNNSFARARKSDLDQAQMVPAPAGVIQLSGPVRNEQGKIAVAANRGGNWDIWVYDGQWRRLTDSPSVEMDPWWEGETLVWASNRTGTFQIHQADQTAITSAAHGAVLPRDGKFLNLTPGGWTLKSYEVARESLAKLAYVVDSEVEDTFVAPSIAPEPYTPFKSLWPNYIRPDIFAAVTDLQLGIATAGRDVTGRYRFDAAARYSFDTDYLAMRAGLQVDGVGALYRRYPLSYETAVGQKVDEGRNEVGLYWRVLERKAIKDVNILVPTEGFDPADGIELSVNWRSFKPLENTGSSGDEFWAALGFSKAFDIVRTWGNLELYSQNRQSLFGGFRVIGGDKILTSVHMVAGKSWGRATIGHTSFRVGGALTEGYFTQKPSRLFPIRGFDSNVLESQTAVAGGIEIFWPLANLQTGYKTLPVFFHRLRLGTFVDAGFASDDISRDDLLIGAGFELVTSLEMAWKTFSALRVGVAWPLAQPGFLDQTGPVILFQLGRPL
ncbi:MAG: hypothetical protein ACC628_11130 [Pirellulaceae bacterium]